MFTDWFNNLFSSQIDDPLCGENKVSVLFGAKEVAMDGVYLSWAAFIKLDEQVILASPAFDVTLLTCGASVQQNS